MNRTVLLVVLIAATVRASADPTPSPPVKQIHNARLSSGIPIWMEITATDAFIALDSFRDKRHERTYLSLPLKNEPGSRLMLEAIEKAFAAKTSVGVAWLENPDVGSYGPEWRKPEGHQYWVIQSVFNLTPDSTEPYTAPFRAVTATGEIKK